MMRPRPRTFCWKICMTQLDLSAETANTPTQLQPLLRVEKLAVSFPTGIRHAGKKGSTAPTRVRAVNGVSMTIYPKQTLAVVGESGCGKSVTAMSSLQLVPTPPGSYDGGEILWYGGLGDGERKGEEINLLDFSDKEMRRIRGNQIAMIFQEPMTSLNPVYTIGEQITESIYLHQTTNRSEAKAIALQALVDVGIPAPEQRLKEYPHQLSGGMRQRVMIAMALACNPELLLADEPTTALDVTIQAQILELLRRLQYERNMAVMLITHDLGVVAENADVVAVMYAGRVVEYGSVHDVFDNPLHPYTQGLFRSMPVLGQERHRLEAIPGNVPNPANFPTGCPFHPRCAKAQELAADAADSDVTMTSLDGKSDVRVMHQCVATDPPLLEVAEKHWVACQYAPGYENGKATLPDVAYWRDMDAAAKD
jgi:oligopeptide/dipeptide ABC transporter ATP-binding protein